VSDSEERGRYVHILPGASEKKGSIVWAMTKQPVGASCVYEIYKRPDAKILLPFTSTPIPRSPRGCMCRNSNNTSR